MTETAKPAEVEPQEAPKAPETTKPVDFIIPNQHLIERVIDQRLATHASNEKPASSRSKTSSKS